MKYRTVRDHGSDLLDFMGLLVTLAHANVEIIAILLGERDK